MTDSDDLVERLRTIDIYDDHDCYINASLFYKAADEIARLCAENWTLRNSLKQARDTFIAGVNVPNADETISTVLRNLCEHAGYGNVMVSASALWREALGDLAGGEFISGPCRVTAEAAIEAIEAALTTNDEV
ncbi:hypothetical protein ACSMXM_05730 [Pacificimonas sp. ICDLI1SI03]